MQDNTARKPDTQDRHLSFPKWKSRRIYVRLLGFVALGFLAGGALTLLRPRPQPEPVPLIAPDRPSNLQAALEADNLEAVTTYEDELTADLLHQAISNKDIDEAALVYLLGRRPAVDTESLRLAIRFRSPRFQSFLFGRLDDKTILLQALDDKAWDDNAILALFDLGAKTDVGDPLLHAINASRSDELLTALFDTTASQNYLPQVLDDPSWGDQALGKLLSLYGDVSGEGASVLEHAIASRRSSGVVSLLIEHGAPVSDDHLLSAIKQGSDESVITTLLLNLDQEHLLFQALRNPSWTDSNILRLLSLGCKADGRDAFGRTTMMYAADAGRSFNVLKALADSGADPRGIDAHGWNAAMYSEYHECQDTVRQLEDAYAIQSHHSLFLASAGNVRSRLEEEERKLADMNDAGTQDLLDAIDALYARYGRKLPAYADDLFDPGSILSRSAQTLVQESRRFASSIKSVFTRGVKSKEAYDLEDFQRLEQECSDSFERHVFSQDERNAAITKLLDAKAKDSAARSRAWYRLAEGLLQDSPGIRRLDTSELTDGFAENLQNGMRADVEALDFQGVARSEAKVITASTAAGAVAGIWIGVLPGPLDNLILGGLGAVIGTGVTMIQSGSLKTRLVTRTNQLLIAERDTLKARIISQLTADAQKESEDRSSFLQARLVEDMGWKDAYKDF